MIHSDCRLLWKEAEQQMGLRHLSADLKIRRGAWVVRVVPGGPRACVRACGCSVASVTSTLCDAWTVVHQALLTVVFSREEYWSGLPCPSSGDLPDPGVKTRVSCIAGRFFTI